jgi:hypothetical protein
VDRISALGEGQVPAVVRVAWDLLLSRVGVVSDEPREESK